MKLAFICLFVLSFNALAENQNEKYYISGKQMREFSLSAMDVDLSLAREIGRYVDVPLDYNNPAEGQTAIYYHTKTVFNKNKPTMIYFQGGPGGSGHNAHQFDQLMNEWNVVFFDYRGIAFSSPETFEILKNPNYYTSEITARDAREVLRHLGVDQVSVYGHSYGTVVATIFSSLFPEITRAVVLEGTVFHGQHDLWAAPHRQKILQKYFDRLPKELKDKILYYSNLPMANPTWFATTAQQWMYDNDALTRFENHLKEFFAKPESDIISLVSARFDMGLDYFPSTSFSSYYYFHIFCKELSGFNVISNFEFAFNNGRLVQFENSFSLKACEKLNINPDSIQTFSAKNHPITVPVTYFQGTTDGATVAPHSVWHYKKTAKSSAQLFLRKNSGHMPIDTLLEAQKSADHEKALALVKMALKGQILKPVDFKKFKEQNLSDWVMTSK